MRPGDVVSGPVGLSLFVPGDAVEDRHSVVWILGPDMIWRSRERFPVCASASLLLRLGVGPFKFCWAESGAGDAAVNSRTHSDHDNINLAAPAGRP